MDDILSALFSASASTNTSRPTLWHGAAQGTPLRCACQKLDIFLYMRDHTNLNHGLQQ